MKIYKVEVRATSFTIEAKNLEDVHKKINKLTLVNMQETSSDDMIGDIDELD